MKSAKQFVLLGSTNARRKGGGDKSFLAYEVKTTVKLGMPVVVANLDGDRTVDKNFIPQPLPDADYYTVSVSFQPGHLDILRTYNDRLTRDWPTPRRARRGGPARSAARTSTGRATPRSSRTCRATVWST
jgi:hypothetical protein